MKQRLVSQQPFENRDTPAPEFLVVDVRELIPHRGRVGRVGVRFPAEHGEVRVAQHSAVRVGRIGVVRSSELDEADDLCGGLGSDAQSRQHRCREFRAGSLVLTRPAGIDRVVEPGGEPDDVDVFGRGRELVDGPQNRPQMPGVVITPMGLRPPSEQLATSRFVVDKRTPSVEQFHWTIVPHDESPKTVFYLALMTDIELARGLLSDCFDRIAASVTELCDGLTDRVATFRPDPEANTVAWLLWHLSRIQDDHISEAAARNQVWDGWRERFALPFAKHATGFGQNAAEVAAVRVAPDLLAGYHGEVHEMTTAYLATLSDEELQRIIDWKWDPPVTVAVRLISVIEDCQQHLGQAAYVRGIARRRFGDDG